MKSGLSNQLEILAPAKVNLFLELIRRRADGFHELSTVISTVSVYDSIRFQPNRTGRINLQIEQPVSAVRNLAGRNSNSGSSENQGGKHGVQTIPADETNLVYRALELLRTHSQSRGTDCHKQKQNTPADSAGQDRGVDVRITKRIPAGAGMGGASSNAAAALVAGNRIWNLGFDAQTLYSLAAQLGSDVPVFLSGGSALCTGRGEKVAEIAGRHGLPLVIASPPAGLSTADVFGQCEIPDQPVSAENLLDTLRIGTVHEIAGRLFNRLELFASRMNEWIDRMRFEFERLNCPGHQMTGSGSAYFGVFSSVQAARVAAGRLSNCLPDVTIFQCCTIPSCTIPTTGANAGLKV